MKTDKWLDDYLSQEAVVNEAKRFITDQETLSQADMMDALLRTGQESTNFAVDNKLSRPQAEEYMRTLCQRIDRFVVRHFNNPGVEQDKKIYLRWHMIRIIYPMLLQVAIDEEEI